MTRIKCCYFIVEVYESLALHTEGLQEITKREIAKPASWLQSSKEMFELFGLCWRGEGSFGVILVVIERTFAETVQKKKARNCDCASLSLSPICLCCSWKKEQNSLIWCRNIAILRWNFLEALQEMLLQLALSLKANGPRDMATSSFNAAASYSLLWTKLFSKAQKCTVNTFQVL